MPVNNRAWALALLWLLFAGLGVLCVAGAALALALDRGWWRAALLTCNAALSMWLAGRVPGADRRRRR